MPEIYLIIILIIICSITYSVQIVLGIAGTILMLPILGFFFDIKTLIIYSILPQTLVSVIGLIKTRKKIISNDLIQMVLVASVGVTFGALFFIKIPYSIYHILLSIIIIIAGLFMIKSPVFKIGKKRKWILDFSSGMLHSIFGISGPVIITRLMATYHNKTKIRNNVFVFYIGVNLFRAVNYTINSSIDMFIWKMFAFSTPFLVVVFYFADKLHYKIKDEEFKRYLAWLILASGIFLLIKFIMNVYPIQ